MSKRILLIQGHPDSTKPRLCHALASGYITGAFGAQPADATKWLAKLKRLGDNAE